MSPSAPAPRLPASRTRPSAAARPRPAGAGDAGTGAAAPRPFCRRAALAICLSLGAFFSPADAARAGDDPAPRAPKPAAGVLVIVSDTTRADRCSFLGYDRPTTPRLDALARESLVFEEAWSPSSWTMPAHASLFTGKSPDSLGLDTGMLRALRADSPTMAQILAASGFESSCFTNNPWIHPLAGLTRGFDLVDPLYEQEGEGGARRAHDAALAWIRERRRDGRRYFAFVNDMECHAPRNPAAEQAARLVRKETGEAAVATARAIPLGCTNSPGFAATLAPNVLAANSDLYDAEIATVDDEIGRLMDALRTDGALDDTLVVIVSDHGEGLGDHGWLTHGAFLHRNLLRVPLLVRLPGGRGARRVTDTVRLEDVLPTVLEAAGVKVPEGLDGASLLGPTAGRTAFGFERTQPEVVASAVKNGGADAEPVLARRRRSVFDGAHHLIVDDTGAAELYDVRKDPAERTNLAASQPDVLAALRAKLDARQPSGSTLRRTGIVR